MTLQVAVPKTYDPRQHVIVPRSHLREFVGVVDEFGREVTHAHLREHLHEMLGEPLMRLIAHSIKQQDDPTHYAHQDALEAFHARLKGVWHIDRYNAPIEFYVAKLLGVPEQDVDLNSPQARLVLPQALALLQKNHRSDSSEFTEEYAPTPENLFTTAGVNCLWTVIVNGLGAANSGASAAAATAAFNATQARIGVADGTTAATAADTDIQGTVGTNKWWVVVSGAPTITNNQIAFAGSYGTAAANWAWNNFAVDNCGGSNAVTGAASGTRSGGSMLDHLVSAQGTKASGQTWNPTMTLSVS